MKEEIQGWQDCFVGKGACVMPDNLSSISRSHSFWRLLVNAFHT